MRDTPLVERFRGSLVGGLVGDCLGAQFECRYENLVPMHLIDQFFQELESRKNNQSRYLPTLVKVK